MASGSHHRAKRRLDRHLYRLFYAIGRAVARPSRTRPPVGTLRRILIVRHDRIGDWVVTSPVVALLREIAPDAEVDVLASPVNAALVRADDRVTRVIVNDHSWRGWLRAWRELRGRRYDLILSPISNRHLREGLVAMLVGGRRAYTLSVWRPRRYLGLFSAGQRTPHSWRHMTERLLYVAQAGILGTARARAESSARWPMQLGMNANSEHRAATLLEGKRASAFVAVNLSAAEPHREWPAAIAADVIVQLSRLHPELAFVLTPPPGKEGDAMEVVRLAGSARVIAAPAGGLLDLVALLLRASVVITPDSANVHLASACGRPVLVLTSALTTATDLWRPFGVAYRAVAAGSQPVSNIPADAIVTAFESLWAELGTRAPEDTAC